MNTLLKIIVIILVIAFVVAVVAILAYNNASTPSATPTPSPNPTPIPTPTAYNIPIATGTATVKAGSSGYIAYNFTIPSNAYNIEVSVNFTASGGSGNDIKAYVFNANNYNLWKNGGSFTSDYNSNGQVHDANTTFSVQSGSYYLVLDNTFSPQSTKYVTIEASVHYLING